MLGIYCKISLVLLIFGQAYAGRLVGPDGTALVNNFKVCPTSIICKPSAPADVAGVTYHVNDVRVGWLAKAPYKYSSQVTGNDVKIACVVTDKKGAWKETIEVSGAFECGQKGDIALPIGDAVAPGVANWNYCVTMPASTYVNTPANNHWKKDGTAMVYRDDISDPHKIFPPGTDPLVYKFTVPVRSHYAITMDSTTQEPTDFNDCWLKFTKGITLRKIVDGVQWPLRVGLTGSVKAYQNTARRHKAAYSVDGQYHSFETSEVLEPGTEYTFVVEGRSPKFVLHGIILFPCKDESCWHESAHHEAYRNKCWV